MTLTVLEVKETNISRKPLLEEQPQAQASAQPLSMQAGLRSGGLIQFAQKCLGWFREWGNQAYIPEVNLMVDDRSER